MSFSGLIFTLLSQREFYDIFLDSALRPITLRAVVTHRYSHWHRLRLHHPSRAKQINKQPAPSPAPPHTRRTLTSFNPMFIIPKGPYRPIFLSDNTDQISGPPST